MKAYYVISLAKKENKKPQTCESKFFPLACFDCVHGCKLNRNPMKGYSSK